MPPVSDLGGREKRFSARRSRLRLTNEHGHNAQKTALNTTLAHLQARERPVVLCAPRQSSQVASWLTNKHRTKNLIHVHVQKQKMRVTLSKLFIHKKKQTVFASGVATRIWRRHKARPVGE